MPNKLDSYSLEQLTDAIARKAKRAEADIQAKLRTALNESHANLLARLAGATQPPVVAMTAPVAANGNGAHKVAKPRKRKAAKVQFKNPKDPTQTWSGRGRAPGWLPVNPTERNAFRV